MSTRKLWGEPEEEVLDETVLQSVNFNPIIELGMQNIPEIPITVKSSPVDLPTPNLITHTIQLHTYARQLMAILEKTENAICEGIHIDSTPLPPIPTMPVLKYDHEIKPPINFIHKEYCDFALGKGPKILPFNNESHQRALKQCAALALAHIGVATCTSTTLNAVSDALDIFMTNMCKLMRTVVDREASHLNSGFPDVISKVFCELNIGDIHQFYDNRVVNYHRKILRKCEDLKVQCEALSVDDVAPQLKLEEVPELHFPAALDGSFTTSLEPGFQMLQSLEQEQLQGIDMLDPGATDDIKLEPLEFSQQDNGSKYSPSAKKKRK